MLPCSPFPTATRGASLAAQDLRQPGVVVFLSDSAAELARHGLRAYSTLADRRVRLRSRDGATFCAEPVAPGRFAPRDVPLGLVVGIELATSPLAQKLGKLAERTLSASTHAALASSGRGARQKAGAASSPRGDGKHVGKALPAVLVGDAVAEAVWAEAVSLHKRSSGTRYQDPHVGGHLRAPRRSSAQLGSARRALVLAGTDGSS